MCCGHLNFLYRFSAAAWWNLSLAVKIHETLTVMNLLFVLFFYFSLVVCFVTIYWLCLRISYIWWIVLNKFAGYDGSWVCFRVALKGAKLLFGWIWAVGPCGCSIGFIGFVSAIRCESGSPPRLMPEPLSVNHGTGVLFQELRSGFSQGDLHRDNQVIITESLEENLSWRPEEDFTHPSTQIP